MAKRYFAGTISEEGGGREHLHSYIVEAESTEEAERKLRKVAADWYERSDESGDDIDVNADAYEFDEGSVRVKAWIDGETTKAAWLEERWQEALIK